MSALDVDTRSDVYSLGVLLYELLTGTTPLERERLRQAGYAEILRRIKEEDPPKPSTRLSGSGEALPTIAASRGVEPGRLARLMRGELDWIVMKALEKDRARRYETANALARDVERYIGRRGGRGEPAVGDVPAAQAGAEEPRGAGGGRGDAGVLVAATGVSAYLAVRAAEAERTAEGRLATGKVANEPDPQGAGRVGGAAEAGRGGGGVPRRDVPQPRPGPRRPRGEGGRRPRPGRRRPRRQVRRRPGAARGDADGARADVPGAGAAREGAARAWSGPRRPREGRSASRTATRSPPSSASPRPSAARPRRPGRGRGRRGPGSGPAGLGPRRPGDAPRPAHPGARARYDSGNLDWAATLGEEAVGRAHSGARARPPRHAPEPERAGVVYRDIGRDDAGPGALGARAGRPQGPARPRPPGHAPHHDVRRRVRRNPRPARACRRNRSRRHLGEAGGGPPGEARPRPPDHAEDARQPRHRLFRGRETRTRPWRSPRRSWSGGGRSSAPCIPTRSGP